MRTIHASEINELIYQLCIKANCSLPADIKQSLDNALIHSTGRQKDVLNILIENIELAEQTRVPVCQDTGIVVVFLEIGQNVMVVDGYIEEAINDGVRRAYQDAYLRKSVVSDPVIRKNTGDNTPAMIHTRIVEGDSLRLIVMPKGCGGENMSSLWMLKPTDSISEIISTIVMHIKQVGAFSCPPLIIGVGIGGSFEVAPLLAKKALLRLIGESHPMHHIAEIEHKLLEKINKLRIGPAGLGGTPTALTVNIETCATHIASLPVAVSLCCYANRHSEGVL
ncbi:fumarate hydratase [Candidatus Desantisbacteria bacterium CG2_30_40_21]|uniref:Fumarate hydratase n=5 Tax=unclassified Candidatus Desantisiibacteriota TaxID=3106372 RepID=A0A2M7J7Y8_9BACT|nr:MAG: fumarate hydratase [Candidatus Desantisbacteria bacterium CG2_30_40_21]PIX15484.1 MAG: fumarate hydratase [Candidatus Desantisbacteria bacterium CG_4_8_14_3_um_filter_40_12]PIY19589.1 MAG: fumarate hydratase [Candidatus Desantisbacteria bacterium CG_4_10_14_3_um_filter_40_18]PJB29106.1 MAG: fumarate hydratase [Candidatus Desantisbacteria bacterium CG_4_9_14_3_um_filter_40_11]